MSILNDVLNQYRRTRDSGQALKDEDSVRRLAPNEGRGYRMPVIYGNNDYLLTRDAAWTGFEIAPKPWGFLDSASRRQYFQSANGIFSRVFPADKESSGHLIVTNRIYTADDWEQSLIERYASTAGRNFERYVNASKRVIEQREFFERECYMFVRNGARGDTGGVRGFAQSMIDFFALGAGIDDKQPDEEEKDFWTTQSGTVVDTLYTSWLRAMPINRRRSEWLIRHLDTPGLPTPNVAPADDQEWGRGAWRTVLGSYTEEVDLGVSGKDHYRCVKFDGPTGTSYAAFLPISHIPNTLFYEQNWIHHASSLNFPVDASLHFEIVDPDRAERDLEQPITAADAQEEEDAEAGVRTDETTQLQQQGLRQVKTSVRMNREPLAYWQCVLAVYDTDKDELLSKVTRLIKHYKDIHFELCCPNRDQRELFYQSFPGSDILVDDWMHRTDTQFLAAAQPWLTSTVGDQDDVHGLYQGHTIVRDANGVPQKGVPVFYDLQNVVDDEGKAPTEVVVGFPGSGKSVSRGLKVSHEDALRGITQFVWDPKGDFRPLFDYAARMQLDPKKVKLVDLFSSNLSVSLDAIALAEVDEESGRDERESAATEVLEALCRDYIRDPQNGLGFRTLLQQAVTQVLRREMQGGPVATMQGVLDMIGAWKNRDFSQSTDMSEAQRESLAERAFPLDMHLNAIKNDTLGRLLFRDPATAGSMKIEQGDLVIFIALNMRTTDPGQEPTRSTAIADTISGLMTDYIRSLLFTLPDEAPKSLIFDEWHVIRRTKRAEALLDWLRRMGRSKRCMVRQMSQSATDFSKGSLSTVWAGYAQNDEEAAASCELLGIESSPSNIAMLKSMRPGQFLFRDVYGRVAQVQVDIWDDWLLEKFNTQAVAKAASRNSE